MAKSLLIISLPRSMSSRVYRLCCQSLSGQVKPVTERRIKSGEVLNYTDPPAPRHQLYTRENYPLFEDILRQYADGWIIKDVVQPFVVDRFLRENPDVFNVLCIRRNLTDVAYCMHKKRWWYPLRVNPELLPVLHETRALFRSHGGSLPQNRGEELEEYLTLTLPALVTALRETWEAVYARFPCVDHADIIEDEEALWGPLGALGYYPKRLLYIEKGFVSKKARVSAYQQDPLWHRIDEISQSSLVTR